MTPVVSTIPLYSPLPHKAGTLGLQSGCSVPIPTVAPTAISTLFTRQMLSAAIPPTTLMPPPDTAKLEAGANALMA